MHQPPDPGRKENVTVQIVCPHCSFSKSIPEEKIPPGTKTAVCPRCKQRFEILPAETRPQDMESQGGDRIPVLWERRSEVGVGKAFGGTVKGVLFSPAGFFRTAAVGGGIKEPLAFGILTGSLGMMFEIFWQGLIHAGELPSLKGGVFGEVTWGPVVMGIMVLCPVAAIIVICLTSLVLHLLLVMVRGGKNGFEATLRAVSYSQATHLWALIPFVGSLLAGMWFIVVQVISVREMHGVSYTKVMLALLIPFIIMTVPIAALLILFLISL